ncbi:DNA repair protein RadC [Flavobacteriaceae bacterium Ap0902]|nr:DNA repair protein RadC [Flavobacteriaceae bacterium Ap0902]
MIEPANTVRQSNLKTWALDDRPREKMMLKGRAALSDAELLAIIMGSGNREETVVDLAKRILQDVQGNWHELARLNIKDLCKYKGIGEAKAISIITTLEIGKRRASQMALVKPKITGSQTAFEMLHPLMSDLSTEEFYIMFLNQANKVIVIERVSSGGIASTIVDSRVIFSKALENKATSIIAAHNHPSGNLKPSSADKRITQDIKAAGELLHIPLLDHLIITQTEYLSFADEGLL